MLNALKYLMLIVCIAFKCCRVGYYEMSTLKELDEPEASLRILLVLSESGQGKSVTDLYENMSAGFGVGRTATESSRKALIKAGLIEESIERFDGTRLKILSVTSLGSDVAYKIREIEELIKKSNLEKIH